MRYLSEDQATQMMGIGYLGEVRQGPDGNLYQYVQGVDGLGNPIGGFWSRVKRFARKAARRALPYVQRFAPLIPGGAALTAAIPIVQRALPIARQVAPFIPGGAAALTAATPILKEAGIEGYDGLGALYQAPDGTLYQQVQGLDEDEELRGLDEDDELRGIDEGEELRGLDEEEELRGLDEDDELRGIDEDEELRGLSEEEELRGLDEDEELRGLDADEELQGFAEDEELRGVAEDQEMQGIDGYVRQDGMSGLEAYVPQDSPQTRWHVSPAQAPEVWKTLW
jgi:hypothetical protein